MTQKQSHRTLNQFPNAAFDVVALAASSGGVRALSQVLSALPPDFPAAITVVQHMDSRSGNLLANILSRRTPLLVKQAESGEPLRPRTVYVAPTNKHLLVNSDGTLSLTELKKIHNVSFSAHWLFSSVASSFKERAIAVVLTGSDDDGIVGAQAIKKMGGTVIVQEQATEQCIGIASAALHTGSVDFILSRNEIPAALVALVMTQEVGSLLSVHKTLASNESM